MGFQSQPCGNTIQDHLEGALAKFLRHPVRVVGASRTDTGVHARQQLVLFRTDVSFEATKLVMALHALMPHQISVASLTKVAESFHPIRAAKAKLYSYKLWTSPFRDAQRFAHCWWVKKPLDLSHLRHEAGALVGRHDFASFCAADSSAKTTVRLIYDIRVRQMGSQVEIWILGQGFLKQMVRAIVGTLVQVSGAATVQVSGAATVQVSGAAAAPRVKDILAQKNRSAAGVTAPAEGLTLERVFLHSVTMISDGMLDPHALLR